MKKVAGIILMVVLLGFNAYLWPKLLHAVKNDQRIMGTQTAMAGNTQASVVGKSGDVGSAVDLSNQVPQAANVSAYAIEQPVVKKNASVAKVNTPTDKGDKKKIQQRPMAVQTASDNKTKKSVRNASVNSQPSTGPNIEVSVSYDYSFSSFSSSSSNSSSGTFNMPKKYNPYTGKIEDEIKIYAPEVYMEDHLAKQPGYQQITQTYVGKATKKAHQPIPPYMYPSLGPK